MYYNNADAAFHQSCTHLGKRFGNLSFLNALGLSPIHQSKNVSTFSSCWIKPLCDFNEKKAILNLHGRNSLLVNYSSIRCICLEMTLYPDYMWILALLKIRPVCLRNKHFKAKVNSDRILWLNFKCRLHPFGSWNNLRGNSSSAVTISPCVQATCPSFSLSLGHQLVSTASNDESCSSMCFIAEDLVVCFISLDFRIFCGT